MQRHRMLLVFVLAVGAAFFFSTFTFAFNGPSANPPTGSGSLYLDTNSNLGIGTTNPTPTNLANGRFFAIGTTTNPGLYLRDNDNGAGKYVIYVKSSGNLAFFDDTNNAERFYIATSGDVYVAGNVYANAFVGALSGALNASNVSSGVFGSGQGNGAFAFPASLGVGTSSQTGLPATLTVYGTGRFTGTSTASGFCLGGSCKTSWSDYWILNGSDLYVSSTSWDVGIGTTTPAYDLTVSGQIYSTGSSTASAFCLAGNCQTSWSNLGQWTTVSGGIYYLGNVSVGTTTVGTYPLYVATSTDSLFAIKRIGATYPTIFKQGTDGVLIVNNANTDTLTLKNGNVGIGTNNPATKLDVYGNIHIGTVGPYYSNSAFELDKTFTSTSGTNFGGNFYITGSGSGSATQYGYYMSSVVSGNHETSYGTASRSLTGGSAVLTNSYGVLGVSYNNESSGSITNAYGVMGEINANGGTLGTGYALYGKLTSSASAMSTGYGLYIHVPDGVATNPWGIYINSSAKSYLGTGNVGIASSSPGYGLTVVGTGYFSQPVIVGTPTGNTHAATKAYVDTAVLTAGTNYFTLSSNKLYPTSTNYLFGIGTTTPSGLLTIASSTGGGTLFTVTGAGNVGIGTANPSDMLHIEKNSSSAGDVEFLVKNTNASGDVRFTLSNSSGGAFVAQVTGSSYALPNVGAFATNGSLTDMRFVTNGDMSSGGSGIISFYTGGYLSSNERMRITSAGYVGIASSSPGYGLTVVGTGYFSQPVIVGTPTGNTHAATKAYVDTAVGGITGGNLWAQSGSYLYPSSTSWNVGVGTTTPSGLLTIASSTGGGTLLTVTGAGNVGIGTASPAYKLDVNGGINFAVGSYISVNTNRAMTQSSNNFQFGWLDYGNYVETHYGGAGDQYTKIVSGGQNTLYADQDAEVGIGTSTPAYKLTVVGTGYFSQPIIVGTPTENTHATTKAYVDTAVSTAGTNYFTLNGTSLYPTSTSYKLGVATTTPAYTLTVSGQIYSTGSSTASAFCLAGVCQTSWSNLGQWTTVSGGIYYLGNVSVGTTTVGTYPLYVATSTDSLFAIKRIGATYPTIFKQGTNGVLVINNANTDTLTLNGGNIGVGTTTPSAKLHLVATTEQLRLGYNTANYFKTTVGSAGDVAFDAVGTSPRFSFGDYVGIASTTPGYNLTVVGTGYFSQPVIVGTPTDSTHAATKAYVDASGGGNWTVSSGIIRPSSTSWSVGIATTTFSTSTYKLSVGGDVHLGDGGVTTDLVVYGGSGKIDAGTVDPVYTIGGKRYATFMAGMTGVKEETTGALRVTCSVSHTPCSVTIDFKDLDEGSDLWLFSKTTNLEKNFDKITVLLTPGFNGRVWYESDAESMTLTIFGEPSTSYKLQAKSYPVSYRFTAPRFDWEVWGNRSDAPHEGFNLDKLIFSDGKVDVRTLMGN